MKLYYRPKDVVCIENLSNSFWYQSVEHKKDESYIYIIRDNNIFKVILSDKGIKRLLK